jgi:glycerol-3-phosphate acyltransferase PlsY
MPPITTDPTLLILTAVLGYLLGSIPFGIVITRAMGLGDLRQIGSGNIGATNVLRTGNKRRGAGDAGLRCGKGGVAVLIARWLDRAGRGANGGLAAFLGHLYPVWLKFKGGKGVATFLGILIALNWMVGLAACATWLVAAVVSRTSSIAALVAAASASAWLVIFNDGLILLLVVILTILIYVRHSANLKRIKAGTEPKIGRKKPESAS